MSDQVCSVTPPVSPPPQQKDTFDSEMMDFDDPSFFLEDFEELDSEENSKTHYDPVFQQCSEVFPHKGTKLYSHCALQEAGIIKSGAFELIFAENQSLPDPEPAVELFGYMFVYTDLRDRMDKLFMFARQAINAVKKASPRDAGTGPTILQHRKNVARFLQYCNDYILCAVPEEENARYKFLRSLARSLHLLLVHAGRISEDFTLSAYSLELLPNVHHSLHLRLDLYWYLLQAFHSLLTVPKAAEVTVMERICQMSPGEDVGSPPLHQLLLVVITDLMSVAVPLYNKLSAIEWLRTSPFPCVCMMEVWVLLQHLAKRVKDAESFWVQLHQVMQKIWDETSSAPTGAQDVLETDVYVLDVLPRPTNPLGYSLWFISHLAHLYIFEADGSQAKPGPSGNCFHLVQLIMEKILRTAPKEETLRACLRCCLTVAHLWSPSPQLITLLWEHFFRRLNDRFQLHLASIEGLAVISKNSKALLERCNKWCSPDENWTEQDTSFQLFLRLLAHLLTQGDAQSEWRSIKGRFYSKFHQRKMRELTETGLHNLACLFLTLGHCVDAEEVATKLSTFYDMLDPTSTTSRLRAQVWCGALAMTQLLVKRKKNFSFLAEKLAFSFDSISKQLSGACVDYSLRQELSSLITLYMDGVRDVVEHSDLESGEHIFIGEGIGHFLRSCGESDLRHALSTLDSIVMRLRSVAAHWKDSQLRDSCHPHHTAFAEQLWQHVFPFVCNHARSLTPPLCLADLAVSLTHLSLDFSSCSLCLDGTVGVFKQFTSDAVASSITCHYLSQVLSEPGLREAVFSSSGPKLTAPPPAKLQKLSAQVQDADVVRSWWHCVMLMPQSSPSLLELTQQVMHLPEVETFLTLRGGAGCDGDLGAVKWKVFLRCIGNAYKKAEGLLERQRIRSQVSPYFSGVAQQAAPLLRTMSPLETLLTAYRAVGCLVRHCAPLLYVQSKPCPLPDIIKSMILPASVLNSGKPLHSHFLAAIRETLHQFVEGLGQLDFQRDSYVQRQLRSIVTHFLPRFPLNSWDVCGHPVLRVLRPSNQSTPPEVAGFHQYYIELALEQLRKSSNPVSAEVVMKISAGSYR